MSRHRLHRELSVQNGVAAITVVRLSGHTHTVLVDAPDLQLFDWHTLQITGNQPGFEYARVKVPMPGTLDGSRSPVLVAGRNIRLSRLLLGLEEGELADHVSGDRLDNRRLNLRPASSSQNRSHQTVLSQRNRSGKTGVCYVQPRDGRRGCWKSVLWIKSEYRLHAFFDTRAEAVAARLAAEAQHLGEWSPII